jgi:hypothetical protein
MDMKYVRDEAQLLAQLQRTSREKRETHEIVPGERPGRIVEVTAAEQLFVVEQVDGNIAARKAPLPDRGPRRALSKGDAERVLSPLESVESYRVVSWKNDTSIDA